MWGRSSVWEVLHNPKHTGFQVWNRRQRKRGGKVNPPETWVWSEQPAHEALVSREMFDRANVTAIKRNNVTKAAEGHEAYRKHSYVLRSFLRCGICGLRMHGKVRRGRNFATTAATSIAGTRGPLRRTTRPRSICARTRQERRSLSS
jgi:site-specific DNA recombinase